MLSFLAALLIRLPYPSALSLLLKADKEWMPPPSLYLIYHLFLFCFSSPSFPPWPVSRPLCTVPSAAPSTFLSSALASRRTEAARLFPALCSSSMVVGCCMLHMSIIFPRLMAPPQSAPHYLAMDPCHHRLLDRALKELVAAVERQPCLHLKRQRIRR